MVAWLLGTLAAGSWRRFAARDVSPGPVLVKYLCCATPEMIYMLCMVRMLCVTQVVIPHAAATLIHQPGPKVLLEAYTCTSQTDAPTLLAFRGMTHIAAGSLLQAVCLAMVLNQIGSLRSPCKLNKTDNG